MSTIDILSACSHSGLVEQAKVVYNEMEGWGVQPTIEHTTCLIDALARAGRLAEAESFQVEDVIALQAILAGARKFRDVECAKRVAEKALKIDPQNSAVHVQLAITLAENGRQTESLSVRIFFRLRLKFYFAYYIHINFPPSDLICIFHTYIPKNITFVNQKFNLITMLQYTS